MIKSEAGKLRGVRVMPDPNGILLDSFTQADGTQFGYVIVYGEDAPAVFDGTEWHSILDDSVNWEESMGDLLTEQANKVAANVALNPEYQKLAAIMNISVAPTVIDFSAPGVSV